MSGAQVVVIATRPATRCALCHDDVDARALRCGPCGAWLHTECAIPCPTLGCSRSGGRRGRRGIALPGAPGGSTPSWPVWLRNGACAAAAVAILLLPDAARSALEALQRKGTRSRAEKIRADLATLRNATNLYRIDRGVPPSTLEQLLELESPGPRAGRALQPYLSELPRDPWGRPYHLRVEGTVVRLFTLGADDRPGGAGDSEDWWSPPRR